MTNKDIIGEYQAEYNGQKVTVHKFRQKEKRTNFNPARRVTLCPNCLSVLRTDAVGVAECSGDRLKIWETEFLKFHGLTDENKALYIKNLSSDNRFLELYDIWAYSYVNQKPEEFTCGYTNKIFLPIATNRVSLPDPLFIKYLEHRLGRPLKECEIAGDEDLWWYSGMLIHKYKKGARKVKIPIIWLPDDV